eukprot:TRINITY_DN3143_c2_g2_i2.p1 TRINITY_DN3143_c2_g2~~TRINITY_DN3143_c2_g2_i2.p1  ORF type:complete len:93 (+),score=14.08 TRINITY_DN3143_c2_g2_i2:387-665(+)
MSKEKMEKRSRVKPFLKVVNLQHVMPTRYMINLDKEVDSVKCPSFPKAKEVSADSRKVVLKNLSEYFNAVYQSIGKNPEMQGEKFFFRKLRF